MFRIHIETENAVFAPNAAPELARLLRDLAERLEQDASLTDLTERFPIRDVNGTGVGFAIYLPDHEEG